MDNEARPHKAVNDQATNHAARTPTNTGEIPTFSGRKVVFALLAAFVIGLTLMATIADPLWAAIELAYYRASPTNNAVFLEWATVREVNINGFEILCKRVNDPETAYHPIGSRIALGSSTAGATYNFDVTSGLVPGERYCFRLREITTDGTPGEAFDLCGYGLGLAPPPTAVNVQVSIPVTLTPTVITVTQDPGVSAAPTLAPTLDPFATATPTIDPFAPPTVDPFATATPTIDPFATATPTATFDPFATMTPTPTSVTQPFSPPPTPTSPQTSADPNSAISQAPITETPFEEPTATPTETATVSELPTETPTATATLTTTIPVSITQSEGLPLVVDPNAVPVVPDSAAAAGIEATPTPIYMVVTATPTTLPALVVAPTFTPWPTAVPTQAFALTNLFVPNTQNLMVGLLCLIFISASGLGALGLVTSVLYMRSQNRQNRLPGPGYERRRY